MRNNEVINVLYIIKLNSETQVFSIQQFLMWNIYHLVTPPF